MPQVPIIMPQLGESIAEATIVDIKVKPGDDVVNDQEIIVVTPITALLVSTSIISWSFTTSSPGLTLISTDRKSVV